MNTMTRLDKRPIVASIVLATSCGVLCLVPGCASSVPESGDWSREIPVLAAECRGNPHDPEVWTRLGVAYDFAGQDGEAIEALERAVALAPGSADAGLPLVRLQLDAGNLDRAESLLGSIQPRDENESGLLRSARMQLERERLVLRMRELARQEATLEGRTISGGTIGVLDFPVNRPGGRAPDGEGRTGAPDGRTVADDGPDSANGAEDPRYRGLGRALSAVLTTELSQLPEIRVLERQNLQVLMDEIELAESQNPRKPAQPGDLAPIESLRGIQQRLSFLRPSSGAAPFYSAAVDGLPGPGTTRAIQDFQASRGLAADGILGPRTQSTLQEAIDELYENPSRSPEREPAIRSAPRAGRLLGARHLLGGEIAVLADQEISVRSRVVDSRDGALVSEADVDLPLEEFHRVPGQIILETAADLDLQLDEETRRRLQDLPPVTRSLAAFLAFGRGLEYEDRGLWREASAEYESALRLAPEFEMARERVEVVRIGSASFEQSLQRTVQSVAQVARNSSRVTEEALGAVGTGTKEGGRRDDSGDGSRAVQTDGPPSGTVRVEGQIPVGR